MILLVETECGHCNGFGIINKPDWRCKECHHGTILITLNDYILQDEEGIIEAISDDSE